MSAIREARTLVPIYFALMLCRAQTADLKLNVASVKLDEGTVVRFRAIQTDESDHPRGPTSIGETTHFQIYPVVGGVTYDTEFGFFRYELWVKKLSPKPEWTHFELKTEQSGPFLDTRQNLTFTISDGNITEQGEFPLPLHSSSASGAFLEASGTGDVIDLRLGSDKVIRLQVTNKLPNMSVVVSSVVLQYDDPSYWQGTAPSLKMMVEVPDLNPKPLDDLKLRANVLKALPITFFRAKNGPDTGITARIAYAAQSGGRSKELAVPIKVRFVPSLFYLLLAVVIGSLIGAVARLVDQKRRTTIKDWVASFLSAFVGALVLELIGIVLVTLQSEFKLFGIVLDPFQFPQVVVMALLVGVFGANISEMIKNVTGKRQKPSGAVGSGP